METEFGAEYLEEEKKVESYGGVTCYCPKPSFCYCVGGYQIWEV